VTGHCPDDENSCDGVHQSEQKTAVEGRCGPQRGRLVQPERAREKRLVRVAGIAEEAVNGIEKLGQPIGIEA
jgi:hypothetical protein